MDGDWPSGRLSRFPRRQGLGCSAGRRRSLVAYPGKRRRWHIAVSDGETVAGRAAIGANGRNVHRAAPCVRYAAVPGEEVSRENVLRQRTALGQGSVIAPARTGARRVAGDRGNRVHFSGNCSAFCRTVVATPLPCARCRQRRWPAARPSPPGARRKAATIGAPQREAVRGGKFAAVKWFWRTWMPGYRWSYHR